MEIYYKMGLGILLDTCSVLTIKISPRDRWIENCSFEKAEESDFSTIDYILSRVEIQEDVSSLFGQMYKDKGSLILYLCTVFLDSAAEFYELDEFIRFLESPDTDRRVSEFFLNMNSAETDDILQAIHGRQDLPEWMKAGLYDYFLFPEESKQNLIAEVRRIYKIIEAAYKERWEEVISKQERFEYSSLEEQCDLFERKEEWYTEGGTCCIAFSLLQPYIIIRGQRSAKRWLVLGLRYEKNFTDAEKIDVFVFGKAIGDKTRVEILRELVRSGERTVAELSKKLRITNTVILYHVELLKKSHLLIHRTQGRKVLYSINREAYIRALKEVEKLLES